MARPKKQDALDAKAYVGVRIPKSLRERLEEMARQNGRAITDEVREAIESHAERKRAKK